MDELIIPFVRRDNKELELELKIESSSSHSNNIVIKGESGSGKTSLLKNTLKKYVNDSNYFVLYLNLNADILSSNAFFEILLITVWNPIEANEDVILSIGEKQSFRSFINRGMWKKGLAKRLYQLISESVSLIPGYGAIITKLLEVEPSEREVNNNTVDLSDQIGKFLSYICKTKNVIIAIDNYQFMQNHIKIPFETSLQKIDHNLSFITIYRTENNELTLPLCFGGHRHSISLSKFDIEDILFLLDKMYDNFKSSHRTIANDCYSKTSGNLKEIELYLKENNEFIEKGILSISKTRSLKQVLLLMPDLQRYLVLISTMFPAGLKIEYVSKILNDIMLLNNHNLLLDELQKLVTLGYLVVNSVNHDLVKPSHEKITMSLAEIANEEEFIEFYESIKNTLENLIEIKKHDHDYVYILHCVVGLYNAQQLLSKMNYLIDLINIEYDHCAYYYIVSIYKHIQSIAENLPDICVRKILDSCQKTSEFTLGIDLLDKLKKINSPLYKKYQLFEVKFFTQSYDFEMALEELEEILPSNETVLYKLNILQHIGKNHEAQQMVLDMMNSQQIDKWFYLILRNSAHYFSYSDAVRNLKKTHQFFRDSGTLFEQGTVLNNLGVITIWKGHYSDAKEYLIDAYKIHESINSNEIFEVYCNLGILEFMKGNYSQAQEYTDKALESVPHSLTLDHIILKINLLIIDLTLKKSTLIDVYNGFKVLYSNGLITKDPWIRFQVVYNLYHLELALNLSYTELPKEYYLNKNRENDTTCFEVLSVVRLDDLEIPVSLCLSPNWRY